MTLYADLFIDWTRRHDPMFFSMADSAQAFLGRQPAIHASLGAGIRDPHLRSRVNDKLQVVEQGGRVLEEQAQSGELLETRCRHRSDECCRFEMTFATGSVSGALT
ncbi:hypothetical protein [Salinicola sp. CPA57]|uniref:hypothetical protein n=1 Tax=Salinicola sp. CPA57 TaxID=1949080 RepID=UPI000DA1F6F4|nr:hypothetical protein [Salinicola sp. CPA57]